ncbi:hypothetical protein [Bacteriovorax sp. Seq25_V]|uniref:hypothetical protein n=1 Tax=Bacteriovorax sp. Seq25_V TaxID=1201288 RepID=UPI00038A4C72|nr:hypothetical protein [Bacteriovorax sp. Seq25_V]EQC47696.1 hypothetical protein M900_A0206 [Bacteriovorax sp. Seq25_V]
MKQFNDDDLEFLISAIEETDDVFVKLPVGRIRPEHDLAKDLGLDSLGKINLFYEISDRLETDDEEEETLDWKQVRDILSYIHENRND